MIAVGEHPLRAVINRYNKAWNAHDLDAIVALHAPDMVFENHTAGERAEGEQVREHIAAIFAGWWCRSGPPAPRTTASCAGAIWSPPRAAGGSSGRGWM
jgi:hypothetical protein